MLKGRYAVVVSAAILLAFAIRVIPSWPVVFTSRGVGFQEPDAWFHMRGVHNLLAHFPHHSRFDPYALFPGGENAATGPFWDYMVGATAWLAGAGSPSPELTDEIGAWLPAILGALLPLPVFLLTRRLFGDMAALLSAVIVAIIPGTFLWVGHLGMADHHAAEVFLSLLALTFLCTATESSGTRRWALATLAGLTLAAYLETQVTGFLVPAVFAAATIFQPEAADVTALTLAACCILLLPAGGVSPWPEYRWMTLFACLASTAPLVVLNRVAARRSWSRPAYYAAVALIALLAIGATVLAEPERIRSLLSLVLSYQPGQTGSELTSQVKELQPLWLAAPGGLASLFFQFGGAWVLALPGSVLLAALAWRTRRAPLTLFAFWSLAMTAAVVAHVRMAAYAGIVVAILAGAAGAWMVQRIPPNLGWLRGVAMALLAVPLLATSLPTGFTQTTSNGMDPNWWDALHWIRWNTPEPLGTAAAWEGLWPQRDAPFPFPTAAYGVIAPWDKGWWISGIARRIPASNGGQSGALATSRFMTETFPEEALRDMSAIGARYVTAGPGVITFELPGLVANAGRRIDLYSRELKMPIDGHSPAPLRLYLPDFYRSMAARLYVFDGHRVDTAALGVQVFLTEHIRSKSGVYEETIGSIMHFASEKEAMRWMTANPSQSAVLASADPSRSCVDLEELPWLRRVFTSKEEKVVVWRQPVAVKVFQLSR